MIYGYARVSTNGQKLYGNSLEEQSRELKEFGAMKVFKESYTGTSKNRPQLEKLLRVLKEGDVVIVSKLDRIARNVKHGIGIIEDIVSKGCKINILNMGTFDNTAVGRLLVNVLLAFAEFERDMIVERTCEGKAIARSKEGYKEGRPEISIDYKKAKKLLDSGLNVSQMCKVMDISRSLWYKKSKERGVA